MRQTSPFALLPLRRFGPYFLTQLLGAFNDNIYKSALIALVTVRALQDNSVNAGLWINLAAGLFILPFFVFSALGGRIADRFDKAWLIRQIKLAEIAIMLCGAVAFLSGSLVALIVVLFLMGTQSAFFGPIKYAILPEYLHESELVGGNGLVELGTFLAILLGTIVGTQLMDKSGGAWLAAAVIVLLALMGWLASRAIPAGKPAAPDLPLAFNPLRETWQLVRESARHRIIFQSILGISWFWLLGATYLAQMPVYATGVLGGGLNLVTLLLAAFSLGIGVGSMLCERLSHGQVEIGLVPFGAIGITLFGLDLVWATPNVPPGTDLSIGAWLATDGAWRLLADLSLVGLFGGFYIVPLYALIQKVSAPDRLARAMACNNILNAVFMVASAVLAIGLLSAGLSIAHLFLVLAIGNTLVAAYIFRLVPEFLMRFLVWLLIHTLYRMNKSGLSKIPETGPAILVANHVSFVDALVIGGCVRRPVRFVMYYRIFQIPVLSFIFRTARAIPIAGSRENPELYRRAFEQMHEALDQGDIVALFPEGKLSADGDMDEFRPGVEKLLRQRPRQAPPVPVIPVALQGLWGSLFSRQGGRAIFKRPRRLFARLGLVVGEPIAPGDVSAAGLREQVLALRGERR